MNGTKSNLLPLRVHKKNRSGGAKYQLKCKPVRVFTARFLCFDKNVFINLQDIFVCKIESNFANGCL